MLERELRSSGGTKNPFTKKGAKDLTSGFQAHDSYSESKGPLSTFTFTLDRDTYSVISSNSILVVIVTGNHMERNDSYEGRIRRIGDSKRVLFCAR